MVCRKCGEDKPIDDYYVDKAGYRRKICKQCVIKQSRINNLKAGEKRREYEKQYHKAHRDRRRKRDAEYKDRINNLKTPCIKCGETRLHVLDFHHIKPAEKAFNINRKTAKSDFNIIANEITKCVCMCRNCHAEYHYFYGQNPDDPVGTLEEYIGRKL